MITPTDQPIGHLPSLNAYRVLNKVGCADFPHENFVSASHKPSELQRTVQESSKCGVFCRIVGYSEVQDLDGWIWMPVRGRHQIRI